MTTPRAEWHGRSKFAEVAEAVGVPTDHVLAAAPGRSGAAYVVLYTETLDSNGEGVLPPVLRQVLVRGTDRVLRRVGQPTVDEHFFERMREQLP